MFVVEPYYSVLIPWVPLEYQTQWHPPLNVGPFSVLCRGAFKTRGEAIEWARRNLNGTPYSIREYEGVSTLPVPVEVKEANANR